MGAVTFAVSLAAEPTEPAATSRSVVRLDVPVADDSFLDPVQATAPGVVIRAVPASARTVLESTVPHPAPATPAPATPPAATDRSGPVPVDMSGAAKVLPGFEDLGEVHVDPTPEGVSMSDPTDTASLYEAAGLLVAADGATDLAATQAASVPSGKPSTLGLAQHVAPSCSGTGADGNRVQALYLREATTPSRYDSVLPILRNEVANVDDVFALSAQQTGGDRRVRWVHDGSCVPVIPEVVVPAGSLRDFTSTIKALQASGLTDPARKYLAFTDAAALCGVGTLYEDPAMSNNMNDGRAASYARVDAPCWSASGHSVAAHELTHNLGSVLSGAPHATPASHCTDEADLMCYVDRAGVTMRSVCPSAQEQLLDCNHDDYFNTDPEPGNFLHDHWNTARSSFLDADAAPGGGTVDGGTGGGTVDGGTPPVAGEATTWSVPTVTAGDPVRIRAVLTAQTTGLAVAAAPVELQARSATGDRWQRVVAGLISAADGSVQVEGPRVGGWYRFAYLGDPDAGLEPSTSPAVLVKTRTHVRARWKAHRHVVVGRMLRVDGTPVAGARVVLERRYAGGDWVRVGRDVSSWRGLVHLKQKPRRAAYFRWVYRGDEHLLGARSSAVRVRR
ncbi:MAG: hypothetical protein ACTHKG_19635 [Nocardioides sp.]